MTTVAIVLGLALVLTLVVLVAVICTWRDSRARYLMQEIDIYHRIETLEAADLRTRRDLANTQTDLMHVQQRVRRVESDVSDVSDPQFNMYARLGRLTPPVEPPPPVVVEEEPAPVTPRRETLRFPVVTAYKRLLQDDDD
jgi:hypothetical protein